MACSFFEQNDSGEARFVVDSAMVDKYNELVSLFPKKSGKLWYLPYLGEISAEVYGEAFIAYDLMPVERSAAAKDSGTTIQLNHAPENGFVVATRRESLPDLYSCSKVWQGMDEIPCKVWMRFLVPDIGKGFVEAVDKAGRPFTKEQVGLCLRLFSDKANFTGIVAVHGLFRYVKFTNGFKQIICKLGN